MCNISRYIEDVKSEDWKKRQHAVEMLGKLGEKSAINALIDLLNDPQGGIRWRAVRALGKIGQSRITPFLIDLLGDKDGEVRLNVVKTLGEIRDIRTVFLICKMLDDDYEISEGFSFYCGDYRFSSVRGCAIFSLMEMGDAGAVPFLRKRLKKEKNNIIRLLIIEAIEFLEEPLYSRSIVYSGEVINPLKTPVLQEVLPEKSREIVTLTGSVLPEDKSEKKEERIPLPARPLPDKSEKKEERAPLPSGPLPEKSKEKEERALLPAKILPEKTPLRIEFKPKKDLYATGKLKEDIVAEELSAGENSCITGEVKDGAEELHVLPVENTGEERQEQEERDRKDQVLSTQKYHSGNGYEEEIARQLAKFESTCMFTRLDAVQTLEKIGKPAVKFLCKALEEQDWRIREGVAEALLAIGDINCIEALKKALPIEPEDSIRKCIERAINKMEMEEEIKSCIEKFNDNNVFVQLDAIKTLENIGSPAVNYLLGAIKDDNWKIREGAVEALSVISDEFILEILEEALSVEKDDYIKKVIKKAMIKLEK